MLELIAMVENTISDRNVDENRQQYAHPDRDVV